MFYYKNLFDYSGISTKITNNENEYVVVMSLPGLSKSDLKIEVEKGILSITSKKTNDFIVTELSKSYTLPDNVDVEMINAECENGILKIMIPLKVEKVKSKFITIK